MPVAVAEEGLRFVLVSPESDGKRVHGAAIARQHPIRRLALRVGGERLPERRRDAGEGRMATDQRGRRERELAAAALDLGGLGADVRAEQVEMAMDRREPRFDARGEPVLVVFDALGEGEELARRFAIGSAATSATPSALACACATATCAATIAAARSRTDGVRREERAGSSLA